MRTRHAIRDDAGQGMHIGWTDAYVYAADLYCDDCGRALETALDRAQQENTGDSNDYPQGPYPDGGGESDGPQHCGSGAGCVNAMEFAGTRVGVWLGNPVTGTMVNCTIANNKATASGQVSGAIFGDGLTLTNTIIANNTAQYDPSCEAPPLAGSAGNLQWPSGSLCTTSPTVADPMLGALGSNGGPTATMLPAAGSPAAGLGTTDCPTTDQRGNPRSTPCTAGAVELP